MALTCNIDNQGAKIRKIWGIMALLVAALLAALAFWSGTWWLWIIVPIVAGLGSFAIFESRKKWCALRAMGIKTPT